VPEAGERGFPLEGRSLTLLEMGEALFTCMDRRIDALERAEPWPNRTDEEIAADLDSEIARVEARRIGERLAAGEAWEDIRSSVLDE
jgi:hypothetical protein